MALLLPLATVCTINVPLLIIMPVRSEVLDRKNSTILLVSFVLAGFYFFGRKVVTTVSGGIAQMNIHSFILASMLTFFIMFLLSLRDVPSSVQQIMVMCIAGIALGESVNLYLDRLAEVMLSWVMSMIAAVLLSFAVAQPVRNFLNTIPPVKRESILRLMMVLSLTLLATAYGSSTVATSLAPLSEFVSSKTVLLEVTAIFVIFGVIARYWLLYTIPPKLLENLDVSMVMIAQTSAALSVLLFSSLGMPVSINHAIFASLLGMSYVKNIKLLERKIVHNFVRNVVLVPLLSLLVGFFVALIL